MSFLNSILRSLFDWLLYPFAAFSPLVGLSVVSLFIAALMLWVIKKTSDQDAMDAVKRKIHAGLFEIRLFNDDLFAIMRALGSIIRHNISYVRLTLIPLLWMIVPIVLSIAQLQFHYGYEGLEPGQTVLVTALLKPEEVGIERPAIELDAPDGVKIESDGGAWLPPLREMIWQVSAQEKGSYQLELRYNERTFSKSLEVSDRVMRRSPSRSQPTFLNELLYPAEPSLPSNAPFEKVTVAYPGSDLGFLNEGSDLMWMVVFLVLSVVFAFALRKPFGVTI